MKFFLMEFIQKVLKFLIQITELRFQCGYIAKLIFPASRLF